MRLPTNSLLIRQAVRLAALAFLFSQRVSAHHGRDFLLVQDSRSPEPLSGDIFSSMEWSQANGDDEFGIETGLLLGLAPRLSLGTAVHFSDAGDGWNYSSVMPFLHLDLTPSDRWPVRMAIMAGYEFAEKEDARRSPAPAAATAKAVRGRRKFTRAASTGGTSDSDPGSGGEDPVQCGPDYGPDAPPCEEISPRAASSTTARTAKHTGHTGGETTTPVVTQTVRRTSSRVVDRSTSVTTAADSLLADGHLHLGIHRHGENVFHARLILEASLTEHDQALVNLIHVSPEHGKAAWGYAAGLRHSFSHAVAVGIEGIGDFGLANEHELVLGLYLSPSHHFTVKLGAGLGLTKASPDSSLRAGLVWRF